MPALLVFRSCRQYQLRDHPITNLTDRVRRLNVSGPSSPCDPAPEHRDADHRSPAVMAGWGEATALALAQEDANGAVADLAAASAEETVAPINHAGGQAMSLTRDITDATAVSTQMKYAATRTARS
jgi:hypothetical protein